MISFDGLYVYHCPPSPSSRNRTINPLRMNTAAAINTVTAPGIMGCHCSHGLNVGISGQQLVHQPISMQNMGHCAHRLNVGISGQQLVPIQHVRHAGAVLQQQLVPMQHVQYIQQQPAMVVGVNPCHQMLMQPGMVMGSVVATPVLTTPMTTTTMMPAHYCQSSLAMVQMPMSMVGVPQVVSSVAVPVPGQVIGEVTVVGV